jgi:3-oxoacyl-[acyl-carrier-protein] synthase III
MMRARIVGTGQHLPEKVLTNHDLEKTMDTSDEWIRQRTGIAQRYMAAEAEGSSDLAIPACKNAMEAAGVKPEEIDLIICATMTPDYLLPSSACMVQRGLGAKNAGAMDLNAACSGFVYGITTAQAYIRAGMAKTILLVGAEIMTNRLNWDRRDTAVLFGDGAGAVVLRAEEGDAGVLSTYVAADGDDYDMLFVEGGGSKYPLSNAACDFSTLDIQMKGAELFKKAVLSFGLAVQRALEDSGFTGDEIDAFVPHQANTRIILAAAERIGLPKEKVILNIERVANTTAASIPIALDDAVQDGRIKEGSLVLLAAFGGGITWGSAMVRW